MRAARVTHTPIALREQTYNMGLDQLKSDEKNTMKESRKIKKPIIEKQRRKRINDSLYELKRLVLEALHKDISLYEKMEKADVLELTVKYLKSAQSTIRQQDNQTGLASYQAGFRECQDHMTRLLITDPTINPNQKSQLISHIASSRPAMTLNLPRTMHSFTPSYPTQSHIITTPPPSPIPSPTSRLPTSPTSPVESLPLLSQNAEAKPNRMLLYNADTTRANTVWRPWQKI